MRFFFLLLIILAMGATLVVLIRGIVNFLRHGDPRQSNKFMQMRVMFQFVALMLIAAFLMLARH
jgi:hypothetical protein